MMDSPSHGTIAFLVTALDQQRSAITRCQTASLRDWLRNDVSSAAATVSERVLLCAPPDYAKCASR
jgi:hypothetical protein